MRAVLARSWLVLEVSRTARLLMRHPVSRARELVVQGATAPQANAPVRECGVKDQVSWGKTHLYTLYKGASVARKLNLTSVVHSGIAVSLALALSGCAIPTISSKTPSVQQAQQNIATTQTTQLESSDLLQEGTLTIGVDPSAANAPFCMVDGNSYKGIDVTLGAALAQQLGLKAKFVAIDSAQAAGTTADIVMAQDTTKLPANITSAATYATTATGLFTKGTTTLTYASELDGATVAVQEGSQSQAALQSISSQVVEKSYSSLTDAFDAVQSGEASYVLCNATLGAYLASSYSDISYAGSLTPAHDIGIAVASSNTRLAQAIQEAISSLGESKINLYKQRYLSVLPDLSAATLLTTEDTTATTEATSAETSSEDSDTDTASTSNATNSSDSSKDGSHAGANAVVLEDTNR